MLSVNNILQRCKQPLSNVVELYEYGFRVYGNFHKHSDYDYIMVVKSRTNEQYSDQLINVNYFDTVAHQHRLNEHEISALECHFLTPEHILLHQHNFSFKLDLIKLRHSLAAKSSNSWVKAKKKLIMEAVTRCLKKSCSIMIGKHCSKNLDTDTMRSVRNFE